MNSTLSSGEMYNPDTKMWTALPDMMVPRSNHSRAVVQGRLVVIGGYQRTETTSKVEVLDSGQVFQHLGGGGGRSRLMASEEESGLLAPEWVGLNPGVGVLFSLQAVALDAGVAAALA